MRAEPDNLEWAVDLTNVAKTYRGKVHALRGIEMRVRRGEIFGLLGPNGAGKSTLVKILMTVIKPTRADGTMLGRPVGHKPTLARVGYLPEHHKFPDYLTGAQVIDFYGALAGTPRAKRQRRRDELLDLVGMSDWANTKVKGYSKGMRQRIGIAQALVNDPALVVLDEPTDGVDPVGRRDIRNILARVKEEGRTVFLNSHLLSELEMVCDRVAILVQGKVASQGTIDELTRDKRYYEIEIAAESPLAAQRIYEEAAPMYAGVASQIERYTMRLRTDEAKVAMPVVDALRGMGVVIRAMRLMKPSLEDLFMQAVVDPATGRTLLPGAPRGAGRGA